MGRADPRETEFVSDSIAVQASHAQQKSRRSSRIRASSHTRSHPRAAAARH
jgi:hypothetical protein